MIACLLAFAAGVLLGMCALAVGVISGRRERDRRAYAAGLVRGARDERARMLAASLWHAGNESYGGTE